MLNLNRISQGSLYIKSLFTKIGVKLPLTSVNIDLLTSLKNTVYNVIYCLMIRENMIGIEKSEKYLK